MARFPLVDPARVEDPLARSVYAEIQRELGFGMVPNIFRSMGAHPALLEANWRKFKATVLQGSLPRTVKELVGVVVSHENGSPYAKQVHLHSLSVQGMQQAWLDQLTREDLHADGLPESIQAIVDFSRRATREPRSIGDEEFETLRRVGLSDAEIFEVVAAVDLFQGVNAYTDLAAVETDEL